MSDFNFGAAFEQEPKTIVIPTAFDAQGSAGSNLAYKKAAISEGSVRGVNIGLSNIGNLLRKDINETVSSSTTLQNDDHLFFGAEASTNYLVDIMLFFNSPVAADFKYNWSLPAGATFDAQSSPGDEIRLTKTTNESVASGLQNDDHLFFNAEASTNYLVDMMLFMNADPINDITLDFTGPAGILYDFKVISPESVVSNRDETASWVLASSGTDEVILVTGVIRIAGTGGVVNFRFGGGGTTATIYAGSWMTYRKLPSIVNPNIGSITEASSVIIFATGSDQVAVVKGVIKTGAASGRAIFQWAQNVSSGTTTVYAGSWMTYKALNQPT